MTPALAEPVSGPRRSFLVPIVIALIVALGAVATLSLFGVIDPTHPFERQKYGFRR